ncbi:MAG TPA: hypothetical protein VK735_34810 [Pseudonocardia sp.]|jgi:hypothetical protein|uniref:hypothetical protein n=1 Tax=Pseudonocardia sp. TaxID=60912 RepID=UPI002BF9F36F|nr:hypothetical protein [Pseudonocardia sp.]HTF52648.1 hypothetical protein [Pseudonocardia sp.]
MAGVLTWLFRLVGWPAARPLFRTSPAELNKAAGCRPRPISILRPASLVDAALGSLHEQATRLCLALLMAARIAACHGWRQVRLGLEPVRSREVPRGPPLSW